MSLAWLGSGHHGGFEDRSGGGRALLEGRQVIVNYSHLRYKGRKSCLDDVSTEGSEPGASHPGSVVTVIDFGRRGGI